MPRERFIVTALSFSELEALGFAAAMVNDNTENAAGKHRAYADTLSSLVVRLAGEWEDNQAAAAGEDPDAAT